MPFKSKLSRRLALGTAVILASSLGCIESDIVTVIEESVCASISLMPTVATLTVGETVQLTVAALDAPGNAIERAEISWRSDSPDVATVSSDGLVTAIANGTPAIVVSALGCSGSATVTVIGESVADGLVTDLMPAQYDTARLQVGDEYYVDRTFTITGLAPGIENGLWIRTANNDKTATAGAFLTFTLLDSAVVAVAYDRRGTTLPDWLQGWEEAPAGIEVSDGSSSPLRVFYKMHGPGPVALGGNLAGGAAGAQSMYVVLLPRPSELELSLQIAPAGATLDPGESVQFSATVADPLGRTLAGSPSIQWVATGGTITAEGSYTAGDTPGSFTVTATESASGLSRSEGLTIRNPNAPASGYFEDDFESGDLSKTMPGGLRTYGWDENTNTSVSATVAYSGNRSLMFAYPGTGAGQNSWAEQRFRLGDRLTGEVFFEWYQYWPTGTEGWTVAGVPVGKFVWRDKPGGGDSNNGKFFRLWTGEGGNGDTYETYSADILKVGSSLWSEAARGGPVDPYNRISAAANGPPSLRSWQNPAPTIGDAGAYAHTYAVRGEWNQIRFRVKNATPANNDGAVEFWINGTLVISETALDIYPSGGVGNYWYYGYLMGWANGGFQDPTFTWIDDFKIMDRFPN